MLQFLKYIVTLISRIINGKNSQKVAISASDVTGDRDNKNQILFKNDSTRLKDEFTKYIIKDGKNKELQNIIFDLVDYVGDNLKKNITITMIYRTQEEQDGIYAGKVNDYGRKYNKRPWKSPHQFYHAVDIRSSNFTSYEIVQIEDYLNCKYNQSNYYGWTARCHNVGKGDHFHIQYFKV